MSTALLTVSFKHAGKKLSNHLLQTRPQGIKQPLYVLPSSFWTRSPFDIISWRGSWGLSCPLRPQMLTNCNISMLVFMWRHQPSRCVIVIINKIWLWTRVNNDILKSRGSIRSVEPHVAGTLFSSDTPSMTIAMLISTYFSWVSRFRDDFLSELTRAFHLLKPDCYCLRKRAPSSNSSNPTNLTYI